MADVEGTSSKEKAADLENQKPKDDYHLVSVFFFLLGLVHLLPWSFFTTAQDYWMYKFRDTSLNESDFVEATSQLQIEFSPTLTITLQIASIAANVLTMIFGHRLGVNFKLFGTLGAILGLLTLSTCFIYVDTDSWQLGFFVLTMVFVALMNGLNSTFGMNNYTILSCFPDDYLGPFLNGQGLSTVFISILQIVSLSIGISVQVSATLYFCIGVLVIGITLTFTVTITKYNKFYLYNFKKLAPMEKKKMMGIDETFRLVKKTWPASAIMFCYLLTLDPVHPAITTLVLSEEAGKNQWGDVYFRPATTFLMVSIADLAGRAAANKFRIGIKGISMPVFGAIRVFIFIPLIILCNAQPRHHLPVVFPHDYQYILIMLAFSLSNGYLLSMCSLVIPTRVEPAELESGYHIYVISASVLLAALSWVSFVSVQII